MPAIYTLDGAFYTGDGRFISAPFVRTQISPRAQTPEQELLAEVLAIIKTRALGHTVLYSSRLTPLIPRLEAILAQSPHNART